MSICLYTSVGGQLIKISSLTPRLNSGNGTVHKPNDVNIDTDLTTDHVPSVVAESFRFSTKSGTFEPDKNKATLALDPEYAVRLIALSSVVDNRTGLKMPCVVVESSSINLAKQQRGKHVTGAGDGSAKDVKIIIAFLSVQKWKFTVCGSFTLTSSLAESATNFFLRDGPTICWEHQQCVYLTRTLQRSNGKDIGVVKLDEQLWKSSNSLRWFGMVYGDAVAMGTEKPCEPGDLSKTTFYQSAYKWVVVRLAAQGDTRPMIDSDTVIPHEYSNIVTCIHFCLDSISQSDDRCLRNSGVIWAATNQFQLVESSGAMVQRVCNLPFNDACGISVAMVRGGEELIAVQSNSGKICTVWKKSFEIAQEWTGFHTALVDDFTSCGSEQILLLGNGGDAPRKKFLLTDLGRCYWTTEEHGGAGLSKMAPCKENLQSAVQALEAQIQTGMASLQLSEQQYDCKEQLIKQSQDALYKMAAGQPSSLATPSISLTCFCDLSNNAEDAVTINGAKNGTLRCLNGWQRVIGDQWVIGVEVDNQTGRSISDIRVSLIPINTTQTSLHSAATSTCKFKSVASSSAFTASDPGPQPSEQTSDGQPVGKRLKLDQKHHGNSRLDSTAILQNRLTTTVIGVTDIPEFLARPFAKFDVMLKWTELSSSNPTVVEKDGFSEQWKSCATAVLYASDVVTGKLEVKLLDATASECETRRDILALDAIQMSTSLILVSKYSSLQALERLLQGPVGFQSVRGGGMICPHRVLGMMRVTIVASEGPHKRTLLVHCRDQSDLLLFCQHLYQLLPDDVTIKPCPPVDQVKSALAMAIRAMDRELTLTFSHLKKLSVDQSLSSLRGHIVGGIAPADGSAEGGNTDKLKKVRGEFEKERARLISEEAPLEVAAADKGRNPRKELLRSRIETDSGVNSLAGLLSTDS